MENNNSVETTKLKIEGMHCVTCEETIQKALEKVPGVVEATVSFVSSEASVTSALDKTSIEKLISAVKSTGYNDYPIQGKSEEAIARGEKRYFRTQLTLVIISAILTFPLIFQMFMGFIGKPNLITRDMVKKGAVVIDVGINKIEDPNAKTGYRLVGDVDFQGVSPICSAITPVPGGVGPMTIAMLLSNTLKSYSQS